MLRIGLTGGIGSGKSTVAQIFEVLGIPVFYADTETKKLMNEDAALKQLIIKHFGNESYRDGKLNRPYIATLVFNDRQKLETLNSVTHPAVMKKGEEWMSKQKTPYAIHEAALVFETNVFERLDYVIGVYAPLPLRIQRVLDRDKVSREEVLKRISRQLDEDEKMRRCDFVLVNDEQQLLTPLVLKLHDELIKLSSSPRQ